MSNQPVNEIFENSHRREDQARELFEQIRAGETQADKLVYRGHKCRHVLAEVYSLSEGLLVHQPVYKLSPALNAEQSVPAGRANNTIDGNNTWKSQVYFIEQGHPNLQCAHIQDYRLDPERIKHDVAQGKSEITI